MLVSINYGRINLHIDTNRIAYFTVIWGKYLFFPEVFGEHPGAGANPNTFMCFTAEYANTIAAAVFDALVKGAAAVKIVECAAEETRNADGDYFYKEPSLTINIVEND